MGLAKRSGGSVTGAVSSIEVGVAGAGEVEQGGGDAVGVVAQDVAFVDEVAGDGFDAEGADAVEVGLDGRLAFAGVLGEQRGRDGGGVDEGVVEDGVGRGCRRCRSAGGSFRCAARR